MRKLIVVGIALLVLYGVGGLSAMAGVVIGIAVGCSFATTWYDKTGLLRPTRVIRMPRRR